jgi:hypothetical protein
LPRQKKTAGKMSEAGRLPTKGGIPILFAVLLGAEGPCRKKPWSLRNGFFPDALGLANLPK